ncbi:hypothetical protein [Pseudomonas syringae]|jgi:hypothetical protein|uniref:Lipoprotein n=1 Tax=Pseudomonas syringae TaxID=317 RepID=A0A085V0S7_PSESX|nr:hypothetical protein [Pseudomonas syringae]KFE49040.1 hypothetical protein IV02_20550 [Pseudomonas syringae]
MKLLIGAVAAVLLVGCTSPSNQARAVGPYKVYATQKAANVVAQCVEYAWQDAAMVGPDPEAFMRSSADGFTVYTTGAEYFVDVKPQSGKTVLNFYAAPDTMPADRRGAALATCL